MNILIRAPSTCVVCATRWSSSAAISSTSRGRAFCRAERPPAGVTPLRSAVSANVAMTVSRPRRGMAGSVGELFEEHAVPKPSADGARECWLQALGCASAIGS